jgi:hypothetical protein
VCVVPDSPRAAAAALAHQTSSPVKEAPIGRSKPAGGMSTCSPPAGVPIETATSAAEVISRFNLVAELDPEGRHGIERLRLQWQTVAGTR